MTRPTIHDVAAAAGVSATTVSHALNRKGRVDPETRERVERIAKRLGYQPNRSGQGLRSGRSGLLALLLPIPSDEPADEALSLDYYMRLSNAAAAAAFAQSHALVLMPPRTASDGLPAFPIDGAVVVDPTTADERVRLLDHLEIPSVTIERDPDHPDRSWYVASQSAADTHRMLDHLADAGARRIAMLVPDVQMGRVRETVTAYESWTGARGMARVSVKVPVARPVRSAHDATARLLTRKRRPDALLAVAERHTHGMLRAVAELGMRCPADILLAAGVDGHAARGANPPVTALDLQPEQGARAAIEMLLARLNGDATQAPRQVSAVFNARASTGAH